MELPLTLCSFEAPLFNSLSLPWLLPLSLSLSFPSRLSTPAFGLFSEDFDDSLGLTSPPRVLLRSASLLPLCLDLPPKSPLLDLLGLTSRFLVPSWEDAGLVVSFGLSVPCLELSCLLLEPAVLVSVARAGSLLSGFLVVAGEGLGGCWLLVVSLGLRDELEDCLLVLSFERTLGVLYHVRWWCSTELKSRSLSRHMQVQKVNDQRLV